MILKILFVDKSTKRVVSLQRIEITEEERISILNRCLSGRDITLFVDKDVKNEESGADGEMDQADRKRF